MQRKKCCYCEQLIPGEGHAKAVEHFRPKAIFKSSRNDWTNLLLACPQCNGKKSNKFPIMLTDNVNVSKVIYLKKKKAGDPAIIDPSKKTNPEAHLDYHLDIKDGSLAGQILARNSSPLGRTTIQVMGLDQSFFHRKRRQHFRTLCQALLVLGEAKDTGDVDRIEQGKLHFQNLMSNGHEFAGMSREFARQMRLDLEYGVAVPTI